MSKQLSTLFRYCNLPREDDGAIEFWRLEDYCIPKVVSDGNWRSNTRKVYESLRPLLKVSLREFDEGNVFKKLLDKQKVPNQPKNRNPIHKTGRLVTTEQTSRSDAQEIDRRFFLDCESTNVSVERLDQEEDADANFRRRSCWNGTTRWK